MSADTIDGRPAAAPSSSILAGIRLGNPAWVDGEGLRLPPSPNELRVLIDVLGENDAGVPEDVCPERVVADQSEGDLWWISSSADSVESCFWRRRAKVGRLLLLWLGLAGLRMRVRYLEQGRLEEVLLLLGRWRWRVY